jgi:hypothetical protein
MTRRAPDDDQWTVDLGRHWFRVACTDQIQAHGPLAHALTDHLGGQGVIVGSRRLLPLRCRPDDHVSRPVRLRHGHPDVIADVPGPTRGAEGLVRRPPEFLQAEDRLQS